MNTHSAVILLAETREGSTVGIKFATRERAEEFERHHQIDGLGLVPVVSQAEAILLGVLS